MPNSPKHKQTTQAKKKLKSKSKIKIAIKVIMKLAKTLLMPLRKLPWWVNVSGLVTIGIALSQFWCVELVPDIEPDSEISSSWADLPMKAINRNWIFDMHNVSVFEQIENVTYDGKNHHYRVIGNLERQIYKTKSEIPVGETITIPCEVFKDIKMHDPDNNMKYMPIELIRLHIRIDYSVLGLHRETTSQSFTWRTVSGGYQWLPGDVSDVLN
jgi:hypothetical protein